MIKNIVTDPIILSRTSEAADRNDMQAVRDLLDTAEANADRCVGMAANMIGVHKTILAALISGKFMIMINPKIIDSSSKTYESREGCLSLSGSRTAIRHNAVTVEFLDRKFKRKKQTFFGVEARIIQHEMDHFEGILI